MEKDNMMREGNMGMGSGIWEWGGKYGNSVIWG
jgi:hypothetical protein